MFLKPDDIRCRGYEVAVDTDCLCRDEHLFAQSAERNLQTETVVLLVNSKISIVLHHTRLTDKLLIGKRLWLHVLLLLIIILRIYDCHALRCTQEQPHQPLVYIAFHICFFFQ